MSFNDSTWQWLPAIFSISYWLVPFVGYIVALYQAPVFARWPPILRTAFLTVFSLAGSLVGGIVIFLCLPMIGIPIMPH